MASAAVSGVGTTFKRWSGTSYVAIAEVNSITGPSMTRAFLDVTSLDSTGGYREFITGFRDAGTISLKMNFTAASYAAIKEDFQSAIANTYLITLSDIAHSTLEFDGLVTELPLSIPTDDKISADCTIKISGEVVYATGGTSY